MQVVFAKHVGVQKHIFSIWITLKGELLGCDSQVWWSRQCGDVVFLRVGCASWRLRARLLISIKASSGRARQSIRAHPLSPLRPINVRLYLKHTWINFSRSEFLTVAFYIIHICTMSYCGFSTTGTVIVDMFQGSVFYLPLLYHIIQQQLDIFSNLYDCSKIILQLYVYESLIFGYKFNVNY